MKSSVVMEEVTVPVEIAAAREQRARSDRNFAWLQARAPKIYEGHEGRRICVAGEELFVADTSTEVLELARARHPEGNGYLLLRVPREKAIRIYADRWRGHVCALG